jgi:hypothetical protein
VNPVTFLRDQAIEGGLPPRLLPPEEECGTMIAPLPKTIVVYFVLNVVVAFFVSSALLGGDSAAMLAPWALISLFAAFVLVTRRLAGVTSIYPADWTERGSQLVRAARIAGGIMVAALWMGGAYVVYSNPDVMLRAGLRSERAELLSERAQLISERADLMRKAALPGQQPGPAGDNARLLSEEARLLRDRAQSEQANLASGKVLSERGASVMAGILAVTAVFLSLLHARDWSRSRPWRVKLFAIVLPVIFVPLMGLVVAGTYALAEQVIGAG